MSLDELLTLMKSIEQGNGWLYDFLSFLIAVGVAVLFLIQMYQRVLEKNRKEEPPESTDSAKLLEELIQLREQVKKKQLQSKELLDTITNLEQANEDLQKQVEEERYIFLQILFAADEVAASLANKKEFQQNRDDIYNNLFDHLIHAIDDYVERGFQRKEPRIVIHVDDPHYHEQLIHFAHSSGHSHRVKGYTPKKIGSAAGRAWRTCQVYYISELNLDAFEYERKEDSRKSYQSLLCVPLICGMDQSTRIGVLSVTGVPKEAYSDHDIQIILLFASLLYPLVFEEMK